MVTREYYSGILEPEAGDHSEFDANLGYIVSSRPALVQSETLSQNKTNEQTNKILIFRLGSIYTWYQTHRQAEVWRGQASLSTGPFPNGCSPSPCFRHNL